MSRSAPAPVRRPGGKLRLGPRHQQQAAALKVLGDPTRLAMVQLILEANDALCVCELERHFDLTQPTISHHVKALREAGLITTEKRGSWVHCRAERRALQELAQLLVLRR